MKINILMYRLHVEVGGAKSRESVCYRGNVYTEPLPSNDMGIFTEPLPNNDKGIFTEPLPSNDREIYTEPLPSND
jgi:hypothetical protein